METKYEKSRPSVPAEIRRQAMIESGHSCAVAGCEEHTYLELHHINGNREDNRIENAIILCDRHHKMAHAAIIDRKSLVSYKEINQQQLGLPNSYRISNVSRIAYLEKLAAWATEQRHERESPNLGEPFTALHIEPTISHNGTTIVDQIDNNATIEAFYDLLIKQKICLLLGNGGSGKTITLLSFVLHLIELAKNGDDSPLPIYVPLHRVSASTDLSTVLHSSIKKHGIQISLERLDSFLDSNRLCIIFDGFNEINKVAVERGAVEDFLTLIDRYPDCYYIISSRYVTDLRKLEFQRVELDGWNSNQIKEYLVGQLGKELGEKVYRDIGDEQDFEWLTGCSVAGLCSSPLTLWMLTTVVLKNGYEHAKEEEIIDSLVDLALNNAVQESKYPILVNVLQGLAEDFAYLMLDAGDIFSTTYESAIQLIVQALENVIDCGLISKDFDAYEIFNLLVKSGLLRYENLENIEWVHQAIQERLSIKSSERRFGDAIDLALCVTCPTCGYHPESFFESNGTLFGFCEETSDCSKYYVNLPSDVLKIHLKDELEFIDCTEFPTESGVTNIPNRLIDERWMAHLPLGGMTYLLGLSKAQQNGNNRTSLHKFIDDFKKSEKLVLFELACLINIGMLQLVNTEVLTQIKFFIPPITPHLSLYGYNLVTLRPLSFEELSEDPDERFGVTSAEKELRLAEKGEKNQPVYHTFPFNDGDKNKVFELAKRFGGQVCRTWGSYNEVVAEFPGDAWDFTEYNQDSF